MTIKELLHRSMKEIFYEKIEDAILFVKRESKNMVISCSSLTACNIKIDGPINSLESFSMINPESMTGMAIITDSVTYWFEIISNNVFEIRSSSNLMGKSIIILFRIVRKDNGQWIVENKQLKNIPEQSNFQSDHEMVISVFDILVDYGNPYYNDQYVRDFSESPKECIIKVDEAILNVNGFDWFTIPNF